MSDMDIGERRKPQDGRITVKHNGQKVDLRVAALPTVWGEKIVMRILSTPSGNLKVEDLNFSQRNFDVFSKAYNRPYGLVLVTGPTGSGKSTTLYATLGDVAKPEINIITVEDPVEFRMRGINQVQVNNKAGMTFAAALRSILRADPDVVLIGEIRDQETANIAIEASLTGHLVLSTLHTNDAPSAVTRFDGNGCGAVPIELVACCGDGSATGSPPVQEVQASGYCHRSGASDVGCSTHARYPSSDDMASGRMPRMRQHRL